MGALLQEVVVELSVQDGEELWEQGKERVKDVSGCLSRHKAQAKHGDGKEHGSMEEPLVGERR